MSDLYDSLEDECDESKRTFGSQDEFETLDCFERTLESESPKKYSFYLRENSDEDENEFQFNKSFLSNRKTKEHFLPKIENNISSKGVESVRNIILENHIILSEQGLQLNNDGSITKSPRCEKEELPFITREYRNLQFQKKKTYADNIQKKSIVKNAEKPGGESNSKHNSFKHKRGSCGKIISENFLSSNSSRLKADKELASNYNMTDSMKEKMFQSDKDALLKTYTTIRNFAKTNCDMTSSEASSVLRQNKFKNQKARDQTINFRFTHRLQKNFSCLESGQKQFKTSKSKIHGYLSDISLTAFRPKLNYSERHKLENGFNIFHLKQLNKKEESDTNRSNFGDSVTEELPEVSSGPVNCDDAMREDEELFYQKLIERDKSLKQQNHLTARSEGPINAGKLKNVLEEKKIFLRSKNITKAINIDLDTEVDNLMNSFKKFSHFCPTNSSSNSSKIELALKGKTYGYLANARNIFKLKAQSEKKLNAAGKEKNFTITQNISPLTKKVSDLSGRNSNLGKQNSSSTGIFPNVKGGLPRYLEKSPRRSKTLSKTKFSIVPVKSKKKLGFCKSMTKRSAFQISKRND